MTTKRPAQPHSAPPSFSARPAGSRPPAGHPFSNRPAVARPRCGVVGHASTDGDRRETGSTAHPCLWAGGSSVHLDPPPLHLGAHRPGGGPPHVRDEDCTLDANDMCVVCGVWHGEPCFECGGRGFHRVGCPDHFEGEV